MVSWSKRSNSATFNYEKYRFLLLENYNKGHKQKLLLADVEIGWKFAQHSSKIVANYSYDGLL